MAAHWESVPLTKDVEEEAESLKELLKLFAYMPKMRAIRILLYLQNYVCHGQGDNPLVVKTVTEAMEKIGASIRP